MTPATPLSRLQQCTETPWDILVIGGGATGAGVAFDATTRGFKTLLLEQADFGKGTSSRSTKLLHGGVRYLAQGDIVLVMEALRERGIIMKNALHLSGNQEFVIPVYSWWEALKYTVGLKIYDLLAGRRSLGRSHFIGRKTAAERLPRLKRDGLKGGVVYHDGQFDDSRLLISLIRSIEDMGGTALNYCRVSALMKNGVGRIEGIVATDMESGQKLELRAGLVVNATGVFVDNILRMDQPVMKRTIRPSQGVHLVFDRAFLQGNAALMIPKTEDGRVLFAIPWYDKVVAGTTDTPVDRISDEPEALDQEIEFILRTATLYLNPPPTRRDILSVFAGLRPLAANPDDPTNTREISRRHKITVSPSGLVTVEGGKWTIYRKMAQDTLDKAMRAGLIDKRSCVTKSSPIHGSVTINPKDPLRVYGKHASEIVQLMDKHPSWKNRVHPRLPYTEAELRWICRFEKPRKLEDVLARRTRSLFLDAASCCEMALPAARIMAEELNRDEYWVQQETEEFLHLARKYSTNDHNTLKSES